MSRFRRNGTCSKPPTCLIFALERGRARLRSRTAPPRLRRPGRRFQTMARAPRYAALLWALGLALVAPASAQTARTVNFYNWSDYIDPTVIGAFSQETGIAVRYDTFDANETLETKLLA